MRLSFRHQLYIRVFLPSVSPCYIDVNNESGKYLCSVTRTAYVYKTSDLSTGGGTSSSYKYRKGTVPIFKEFGRVKGNETRQRGIRLIWRK